MSLNLSSVLLAGFGLSLILITLSLWLLRGVNPVRDGYSGAARFFLICLRLAIGWHCFVEGMEKISTPNWSSEPYLRESMGPLAGFYRDLAGDRLIDKLTVGDDGAFPAELDREWREYLDAFAAYYELDSTQRQRAEEILKERESATLTYLKSKAEPVTKIAAYPPELVIDMTMAARLKEHERLLERVRSAEANFPSDDKGVHAEWKAAKADLAKWRGELKRAIDAQTDKFKREGLPKVLTSQQKLMEPMAEPTLLPMASWRKLEFADFGVKWGLTVLGACLMLGIFSRCSSMLMALLVLSFYLAMPPLPGWPESPRLEGHYLVINKTLIEVIALLALAFIPTGRWAGLDGLLQFVLPGCCGGVKQGETSQPPN